MPVAFTARRTSYNRNIRITKATTRTRVIAAYRARGRLLNGGINLHPVRALVISIVLPDGNLYGSVISDHGHFIRLLTPFSMK